MESWSKQNTNGKISFIKEMAESKQNNDSSREENIEVEMPRLLAPPHFEDFCVTQGNKKPGRQLKHNISGGLIISNQSLVLQKVSRGQGGRYTCTASNIEGDGTSKAITLDIKYSPVCAPGQVTTYGVARHEDAEVTCRVASNPPALVFKWTFNNTADTIDVPPGRFTSTPTYSIITYTPMTELDYGTLLCWAENDIGQQTLPCVFHIVPAGKPDAPGNCSVSNQTTTSFQVSCDRGFDGGLPQVFYLRVAQPGTRGHTLSGVSPVFQVEHLSPDTTYRLQVWAANDKGRSPSVHLNAFTTNGPNTHHVVAEIREGYSDLKGVSTGGENEKFKGIFSLLGDDLPSVLSVIVGVSAGLLFFLVLFILLLRHRLIYLRRSRSSPHSSHSILPTTSPKPILKNTYDSSVTCAERELQAESENEAEPDLIPQTMGPIGDFTVCGPLLTPPFKYSKDGANAEEASVGETAPRLRANILEANKRGEKDTAGKIGEKLAGNVAERDERTPTISATERRERNVNHYNYPDMNNITEGPRYQQHVLPSQSRLRQCNVTDNPRYAHLDLDEDGQIIIVSSQRPRSLHSGCATLDTRHARHGVPRDLKSSQIESNPSHDLSYASRSVKSWVGPEALSSTGFSNLVSQCDFGYPPQEDGTTLETPLVNKRESSV
ncbi:hypothetical protein SK128_004910 [Halocaridina rubra]|uniref:Nephrin n=1 Tax=Halocaridina rubra TaxID=373956 RepID=A0AAN8WX62_HALRR